MRTGRPKQPLILTEEERERLQSLAHRARSQALLARRARVVLACGEGLDNQAVAKKLRCSLGMVGKWRIQALDRTQPLLPMQPGQLERGTHDYKRNGTTSLFAALDLKTSRVISQFHQRHRSVEFRRFLDVIDAQVPAELDVHLILDNYGTHKTAIIRNWLAKRPRFPVPFTPTCGSWLNLVERWFAELTNKRIRRGAFRSVKELESAIREFIDVHNEDPKPFVWTRTADQILDSIARYARRTLKAYPGLNSRTTVTGD